MASRTEERIEELLDRLADPRTTSQGREEIERRIEFLKSQST